MAKATPTGDDAPLKRLGGGRWETRDGRFKIEPQSGTWVVVDAEQTDELGLSLVRGPFGSLTAAKAAIRLARTGPAESSVATRSAAIQRREGPGSAGRPRKVRYAEAGTDDGRSGSPDVPPTPPPEPTWVAGLEPAARRRARDLIQRLTAAGAADAEGIVRRDLVGAVPAVATFAIARAVRDLGADAAPAAIARLLAAGGDEGLGVRWRLVDGDGRVISLDLEVDGRRD